MCHMRFEMPMAADGRHIGGHVRTICYAATRTVSLGLKRGGFHRACLVVFLSWSFVMYLTGPKFDV